MPPLSVLIKPASSACNLRCRYCFYADEAARRAVGNRGVMSPAVLRALLERVFAEADGPVSLLFQGGEPLVAGLPFFEQVVALAARLNTRRLPVAYALQTNGTLVDDEWAAFFARHRFLVGVSLDGTKDLHDLVRPDAEGGGTHKRVLTGIAALRRHGVAFNVLTVVTGRLARSAQKVYNFYRKEGFCYQQYIPCLDPLDQPRGRELYSLTPAAYGQFLKDLFDCWYRDVSRGVFISERWFDNLVSLLQGRPAENCAQCGQCTVQLLVEADGSVYPCDFYALDEYRLGSVLDDPLARLQACPAARNFVAASLTRDPACEACPWLALCRGGCRRDRDLGGGALGRSYFCESYRAFFPYALPRLQALARR